MSKAKCHSAIVSDFFLARSLFAEQNFYVGGVSTVIKTMKYFRVNLVLFSIFLKLAESILTATMRPAVLILSIL